MYSELTLSYLLKDKPDSSVFYANKMLQLALHIDAPLEQAHALSRIGYNLNVQGDFPKALERMQRALSIAKDPKNEKGYFPADYRKYIRMGLGQDLSLKQIRLFFLANTDLALGLIYNPINPQKAWPFFLEARRIAISNKDTLLLAGILMNMGASFGFNKDLNIDSALLYEQQALLYNKPNPMWATGGIYRALGNIYAEKKDARMTLQCYRQALQSDIRLGGRRSIGSDYLSFARYYQTKGNMDSSIYYAKLAYLLSKEGKYPRLNRDASELLTTVFKSQGQIDSAFKYQSIMVAVNDSLNNARKVVAFQNIELDEQLRQKDLEAERIRYQNAIRWYVLLSVTGVFLLIAFILYRNNQQKQRANALLQQQKEKVEDALQQLKAAQAQLIQSEKMASLGELTAGIAHEIQNPINFVNNFSEVNQELIEELKGERSKLNGERNEELEGEILNDIKQNEQKINYHGKRADAIVKGMLQHSRASTGNKEPTDINTLADEYLRLSYHGFRAKDKSFNATIQTHFDESISKIYIVPQEIGRVLLNLFNNAFYAVNERKKRLDSNYEPIISVSTKKLNDKTEISVRDNGNGIPEKIVDKIFQPFFTTKPTGEGTGLGLSLSYDIIKAHGGELKVIQRKVKVQSLL